MADTKRVKKNIGRLQRVKTWQLVVLLVLGGLLSATFLRLNNIEMLERRTAVLQADERGDDAVLKNNLYALQRHTSMHMNADSGVLYLEGSYERESKRLAKAAQESDSQTAKIVKKADKICQQQFAGSSWQAYVQCFANEQAKLNKGNAKLKSVEFPNPELYRHEYASPLWSPDFAGWSLAFCAGIVVIIILRLLSLGILRLLLRKHYSSI